MNDFSPTSAQTATAPARFTAAEFDILVAAGLDLDMKLELADGVLERMSPPSNEHSTRQTEVVYALITSLGAIAKDLLRIELGVRLDDHTVRVPDLVLLGAPSTATGVVAAGSVALAVEIAERTLGKDLGVKCGEYALAGIPTYWVVDGAAAVVHVHSRPVDGIYRDKAVVRFGEPLAIPGADATITLG